MPKNNKIDEELLKIIEGSFDSLTEASRIIQVGITKKSGNNLVTAKEEFTEGQDMILNAYRLLLREIQ